MTRLEKEMVTSDAAGKKDEIVETYQGSETITQKKNSCLKILILFFVFFVFGCAWLVASTGLVSVPVISRFAFHEPKPVRLVEPTSSADEYTKTFFTSLVQTRWKESGGKLTDRSVEITLPESVLTASVQSFLRESGFVGFFNTDRVQIAVLQDNQLELFVPIHVKNETTACVLRVNLMAKNGSFDLELSRVELGSLVLPSQVIAAILQPFVNRELSVLNKSLSSYMRVDSLSTQNGSIRATGTLTVEVKPAL